MAYRSASSSGYNRSASSTPPPVSRASQNCMYLQQHGYSASRCKLALRGGHEAAPSARASGDAARFQGNGSPLDELFEGRQRVGSSGDGLREISLANDDFVIHGSRHTVSGWRRALLGKLIADGELAGLRWGVLANGRLW